MKKKLLLIILLTIILIVSLVIIMIIKRYSLINNNISSIKRFSYSYSGGFSMYDGVSYEINYEEGKYVASILPAKTLEENKIVVEIDKKDVDRVVDVLNKYNVSTWDGFDKSDKDVLDGNSFSLSLTTQDDKKIEAHGYMKWPDNFSKVDSKLDTIFMDIFKKNGGKIDE